jgi:F420-dependent oxidoreductase-like protein
LVTFGVHVEPQFGFSYEDILQIGESCEDLGFSTLTISDHLMLRQDSVRMPCLECWTLLSALAVDLSKVRVGPLVSCNSYRHPSLLAKMAASVDVLSRGRLEFSIGAGWKRLEYEAYGYPFPSLEERVGRMEEAVHILRRMWMEQRATFRGRYYSVAGALCEPKPLQRPHPPIWVGGKGGLLLRTAARVADGVNIPFLRPDGFRERMERLRSHCEAEDRRFSDLRKSVFLWAFVGDEGRFDRMVTDFARVLGTSEESVRRTAQAGFLGPPSSLVELIGEYVEAGAEHIILGFARGWEVACMELLHDEVLPAFR